MARRLLAPLLPFFLAALAEAESIHIDTDPWSGVTLQIDTPFAASSAAQPARLEIRNFTAKNRTWTFEFTSYGYSGMTRRTSAAFSVPSGETRSFEIVVPFGGEIGEAGSIQMQVAGFGLTNPGWQYPLATGGYTPEAEPSIALSRSLHPEAQRGIAFDPALLPSDWRGLLALRSVVLTEEEWQKASPGARTALKDWVARGGRLVRVGSETPEASPLGLGVEVQTPKPTSAEEWSSALDVPPPRQSIPYASWSDGIFPAIQTRSGLLLLYLVCYAVLVGPVNLFVFCSRGRRARLFWTLPSIAIAASFLLGATIVLQDGLGGEGRRVSFVRLVPEIAREVVVQEQVSRTGALLRTGFVVEEPVALFHAPRGFPPFHGELNSAGPRFGGSWFRSRSIQTQRIESVRAGRARVEWASGSSVVSSVEEPIEELHYRDGEGRCWKARDLDPGREAALEPESEGDYERFWQALSTDAGPAGRDLLYAAYWERGAFLARARSSEVAVETLDGIAWQDTVIYSGRILGDRGNP